MRSQKDDIVNKAIEYTRPFRPITFDPKTGEPLLGGEPVKDPVQRKHLIELCMAIQNFVYGDSDESKK